MERRADDAERELVQWKKVRFMADKVGDEFEGYITGVAPFGLFVELIEHFVEGLVHISTMADDYYRFVERRTCCAARTPARRYRLGDRVKVQVIRVEHGAAADRARPASRSWRPCAPPSATAARGAARPRRRLSARPKRHGRPGRRERAQIKAGERRRKR